ncbi:hypothetical protein V6N13_009490 [Hibiscus sabdariffa]
MGLDGCFLKGAFKGVLLGAVGRDGNDQMYPIAWAVAEVYNREGMGGHKQVLSKLDEKVVAELFGKQEKKWTKAFQGLHATSVIVDNNMCEAFNSSIIEARYKSIITMLEEIRVKIMTRIVKKRHFINDYLHSCYLKDTYIKAYSYALQPINGSQDWKKSGIEAVLPPIEREMPGRPKKNRRKAKDEPKKLMSRILGTNKGLHTTLDSMEHNFHSGVTTRQSARTNIGVKRNVSSSSSSVAPKKKRKTTSESIRKPVGTQDSVAPKKRII